jgi:DNA-directed RNA polymerase subunit RPC12/RpoP
LFIRKKNERRRVVEMRKVFLENLPKWESGLHKDKINWKETVGFKVKFTYEDIEGEVEIIEYKKDRQLLYFKYNNEVYNTVTKSFMKASLGKIIGKINSDYIYEIGEIINGGKLKILDKIRKGNQNIKYYKYECLICGNFDNMSEYNLNNGNGCNVCSGKKVLRGVNSIWDTNKKLANMFYDSEDGYRYTENSNKKVDFKCLDCGVRIKNKIIRNVNKQGISCPKCSDGVSLPEKMLYFVLKELKVEFETQKLFNWSKNVKNEKSNGRRRYDFYIPSLKTIIETHGLQHYAGGFERAGGRSLKDEQENDRLKEKLAKDNGIEEYIVIDCRISDMEYIKNNIINSKINGLFDLSNIDWDEIGGLAIKTLVRTACDLFNEDKYMLKEIGKIMNLSGGTITTYLKQGDELGWCDYVTGRVTKSNKEDIIKRNSKPVIQLTNEGEFIKEWVNARIASEEMNLNSECIKNVCRGTQKSTGGFKWKYKDDYFSEVK